MGHSETVYFEQYIYYSQTTIPPLNLIFKIVPEVHWNWETERTVFFIQRTHVFAVYALRLDLVKAKQSTVGSIKKSNLYWIVNLIKV